MVAVPAADVVDELVFCGHRWRFRLELTEEQERLDIPGRLSSVGEVNSPLLARGHVGQVTRSSLIPTECRPLPRRSKSSNGLAS